MQSYFTLLVMEYALLNPKIDSFDYDSYAHLDVKGKWVVVLDGMPGYWKEEIKSKLRYKSTFLRKSTTARDLGAKGIIIIQSGERITKKLLLC